MARPIQWPPTIHTNSRGYSFVRVRGQDHYLGKAGSPEARAEYARLLPVLENPIDHVVLAEGLAVGDLCVAYKTDRTGQVCPSHLSRIGRALDGLLGAVGLDLPAAEVKASDLDRVRRAWVAEGLSRARIVGLVGVIVTMYRWAARRELVPMERWAAIKLLEPLKRHTAGVAEPVPRRPADPDQVEQTLPYLSPPLADAVRLLVLTGARPGEILSMRGCDVDRTGRCVLADGREVTFPGVWVYAPQRHKTDAKGLVRHVLLGPAAQVIVAPYLDREPLAYLFDPREGRRDWEQRMGRQPRRPGTVRPRGGQKDSGERMPRDHYDANALARAARLAIKRLNRSRSWGPPCPRPIEPWTPYQIRHRVATDVRAQFGPEAAQHVLGHEHLSTTELYARKNLDLAARVARERG